MMTKAEMLHYMYMVVTYNELYNREMAERLLSSLTAKELEVIRRAANEIIQICDHVEERLPK